MHPPDVFLRNGKVNACDITNVKGKCMSVALILKRLNSRDRLRTRKWWIDVNGMTRTFTGLAAVQQDSLW